ncbi:hypothetical protein FCL40_02855 [Ferrimonas sediminicola]|uniref:Uncharacterized protein n=1 Tax=Ferrimonas sediminicola TaxID=2569538 RepID=A0A4U1BJB1_9GAMM|nr:DUF6776 family protein [Ferrimonas sediminicola]TKB51509.1 hypothetical protein FCL40_02855 [Ferrimonas sediminicola]
MQNWKHRWHALKHYEQQFHPRGLVLLLILGLAVSFGYLLSLPQQLMQGGLRNELQAQISLQQERIRSLIESGAALEIDLQTERQSQADTVAMMATLQGQVDRLNTELIFYRNIMAPEKSADGVVIHELAMEQIGDSDHYRYKLVLTQQKKRRGFSKGRVAVSLQGSRNGKPVTYSLTDLGVEAKTLSFSFRYFQELEGAYRLPEGFVADQVQVRVSLSGSSKGGTTEQVYPFLELTGVGFEEETSAANGEKT